LGVSLVAHLADRERLLVFQVAAHVRVFAAGLAALGQFAVLTLVQCIYLVI
jgi:hypothetical protein